MKLALDDAPDASRARRFSTRATRSGSRTRHRARRRARSRGASLLARVQGPRPGTQSDAVDARRGRRIHRTRREDVAADGGPRTNRTSRSQRADPGSVLNFVRELIALRRSTPDLAGSGTRSTCRPRRMLGVAQGQFGDRGPQHVGRHGQTSKVFKVASPRAPTDAATGERVDKALDARGLDGRGGRLRVTRSAVPPLIAGGMPVVGRK